MQTEKRTIERPEKKKGTETVSSKVLFHMYTAVYCIYLYTAWRSRGNHQHLYFWSMYVCFFGINVAVIVFGNVEVKVFGNIAVMVFGNVAM